MDSSNLRAQAAKWNLQLPDVYLKTIETLEPTDEVGFWNLSEPMLTPESLDAGAPVDLFPIGNNGMGDYLCFVACQLGTDPTLAVAMWDPEKKQLTRLGTDYADFQRKEFLSRVDFFLDRCGPLSEEAVAKIRAGEQPAFEGVEEDKRFLLELMSDACRVALKLGEPETLLDRAAGKATGTPRPEQEIDGRDQEAIDAAVKELRGQAEAGDGGAAFEVLGYMQLSQKHDEVAKWAFIACRCPLFTWRDYTDQRLYAAVRYIKEQAATLPPADRIDPLFGFLTSQPVLAVAGRLNLAKQVLRKGQIEPAIREAHNALFLGARTGSKDEMKSAYSLLAEVFKSKDRTREVAYCELMQSKLG